MNHLPVESDVPPGSRIAERLAGASFHDSWSIASDATGLSALDHFLLAARRTPRWIEICMRARNLAGGLVGLKNLGTLSALTPGKTAASYRLGDRVGIFTVFENTFDEALIGDDDKHLKVVLGIHRRSEPGSRETTITVTTVVHVKNALGRLYMLPVKPMHRLIAPAVLSSLGERVGAA
ncbi:MULTISPECIES: DUF2867 domain-containing protein [Comamonas]|jgi:hypothetical protein|uniref:DUF2867 domain-containing protein n=1 Tax=Comamonas TaxID=283 RepID=UPI0012CBFC22|nr:MULTISPECIES: DUF2867 domain-containing protein [Comamonas]MDR3067051.1 DUF2867 domain-containing protein [Comamonas sp.]MEB5963170.1 DUF2867 domain-containing protein [Comamonas testosteroni]MPS92114.1 DUF2867 domain-containing protein [Comamonas sp.]